MAKPLALIDGRRKEATDITLVGQTSPLAQANGGELNQGVRMVAGFPFQVVTGPYGKEQLKLPESFNGMHMAARSGGGGTAITQDGGQLTFGTVSHQAFGSTYYSRRSRARISTTAVVGNATGWRNNSIGEITRTDGGILYNRWSPQILPTGARCMVGMSSSIAAQSNIDPLADTTMAKIAMACNVVSGNWNIVHNTLSSAPTVIDLGADFPVNVTDAFDFFIHLIPGGNVLVQVFKLSTTDGSWAADSGLITLSSNLPGLTQPMSRYGLITNNAQATAAAFDFQILGLWAY